MVEKGSINCNSLIILFLVRCCYCSDFGGAMIVMDFFFLGFFFTFAFIVLVVLLVLFSQTEFVLRQTIVWV